jgi:NADH dehydrogenase [ubiquinone] 1 alpha subcomplex assembly factor 6
MTLTTSQTYCLDEVRQLDHDRYLTALLLPAAPRADALALYAFNLEVARTREIVSEPILGQIRLQWWRETVSGIYDGTPREHPVVAALSDAVQRNSLDRAMLEALIDAREADLDDAPPADLATLEAYASDTSGLLSQLVMSLLDGQGEARAAANEVGTAWALVGLARSVAFHAQSQRMYIPDDLLTAYEIERRRVFDLKPTAGLDAAVRRIVERAEALLGTARDRASSITKPQRRGLLLATLADRHIANMRKAGFDPFAFPAQDPAGPIRITWNAWRGRY